MVIRGEDLNSKGFGGIYGVGKASTSPPALAVLSYKHPEVSFINFYKDIDQKYIQFQNLS